MTQESLQIIHNDEIAKEYYELKFSCPDSAAPGAGQFLTLRINDGPSPLLRRPFAFAGYHNNEASIIYQRRGTATALLAGKREGDMLDVITPLGNTWPKPLNTEHPVLVAGGIGIGPILFLARTLNDAGRKFTLIIGARTGEYLPKPSVLSGLDPIFATDDGSIGIHGTVTAALPAAFPCPPRFYACGPEAMMRAVHRRALESDAGCSVSMEQTIACGVGACMGCVIRLVGEDRFARVCADGPIFDSRDVVWN